MTRSDPMTPHDPMTRPLFPVLHVDGRYNRELAR